MRRLLALAGLFTLFCSNERPVGNQTAAYTRTESPEIKAFYKSYGTYYETTPQPIDRAVAVIARETGLPRRAESYPIDGQSLNRAARAFEAAARETFGTALALDSDDAAQLDRFFNEHLIDERLRPFFEGPSLRELSEKESETYAAASESIRVPNEPLLLYAAGAWWGEWLVRHRDATWQLFPPLRPEQSFPDMITASNTICVPPFSQVTTKLSDPEGDALAFSAIPGLRSRYFPPYPLIASIADADHAAASILPPELRREKPSFDDYDRYLSRQRGTACIYALAIAAAWSEQEFDKFEEWSKAAIALAPGNPVLKHNLAVLYSQSNRIPQAIALLEEALRLDENYARAHLTLASCLAESGRASEARKHAEWVRDHDGELRPEAEKILAEIR